MRVNRDGVAHLAAYDDRCLIQLSTDYVFDGTKLAGTLSLIRSSARIR